MSGLMTTLRFILQHPGGGTSGLRRFVKWQVLTRLHPGTTVVVPWIGSTRLEVKRGEHGLTGNIYCTLLEYNEMGFLLKAMREGDTLVDVGANGGAYTVLAAGCIGTNVLAFEPVPETCRTLELNIETNGLRSLVDVHPIALADYEGTGRMVIPDSPTAFLEIDEANPLPGSSVPVHTLDSLLEITNPTFMKIDVEGGEVPVLNGSHRALLSPLMVAAIVEITWRDGRLMPLSQEVLSLMEDLGYGVYSYDFSTNRLQRGLAHGQPNAFFTRDYASLRERLDKSVPMPSLGQSPWHFVTSSSDTRL